MLACSTPISLSSSWDIHEATINVGGIGAGVPSDCRWLRMMWFRRLYFQIVGIGPAKPISELLGDVFVDAMLRGGRQSVHAIGTLVHGWERLPFAARECTNFVLWYLQSERMVTVVFTMDLICVLHPSLPHHPHGLGPSLKVQVSVWMSETP